MKLASDAFTDETVTNDFSMRYANQAISHINTALRVNLPFFTDLTTDYVALSDSWLMRLVGNYISYGVKMNDSSLEEAKEYKILFLEAVAELESVSDTAIDDIYKDDTTGGVYQIDTSKAINFGWFGSERGKQ